MTTNTMRATGVPEGYVEHTRKLSIQGQRVRNAYASGELKKRSRTRKRLSPSEAKAQTEATMAALNF